MRNGERIPGTPKSDAGFRTVALPSVLVTVMREHLAEFPASDPEELIFKGPKGASLRRNNFHRSVHGADGVAEAGLPEASGSTICATQATRWRASSGASTRELMHR